MKQKVIKDVVTLKGLLLTQLPDLSDVRVEGGFVCSINQLKSLIGSPKYVGGSFYCYNNQLKTLEGAPEHVEDLFSCINNQLKTLEGAPKYVGETFGCYDNPLESLEGLPEYIGRNLYLPEHLKELYTEKDIRKMSEIKGKVSFL